MGSVKPFYLIFSKMSAKNNGSNFSLYGHLEMSDSHNFQNKNVYIALTYWIKINVCQ